MIKIQESQGAPMGTYDVTYYSVDESGRVCRESGCDSGVSWDYVDRIVVGPAQIAYAQCTSQPGGITLYGSQSAQQAFAESRFA